MAAGFGSNVPVIYCGISCTGQRITVIVVGYVRILKRRSWRCICNWKRHAAIATVK